MARVLVVDDEPSVRDVVRAYLERDGFGVSLEADGEAGLLAARALKPDLVILDLMLPKLDGLEVCRRLRAESRVPILILTARGDELDRILGLELGADDYVTKPFSPRELVARVRAVLRRASLPDEPRSRVSVGALSLDLDGRRAFLAEREAPLTTLEFDLLAALAGNAGRVLSRSALIERVWGGDYPGVDRVVDVHVSSLRRKLALAGGSALGPGELISTIRGVGYRLDAP